MEPTSEIIKESNSLIAELVAEEGRDLSESIKQVEKEILVTWKKFEEENRLRHTPAAYKLRNELEALYLRQSRIRGDQLKCIGTIKGKLWELHSSFVNAWQKTLFQDILDLQGKRKVHGEIDREHIDRLTGDPAVRVTHNLKAATTAVQKIHQAYVDLKDGCDGKPIDQLQAAFNGGHAVVDEKLAEEEMLMNRQSYEDLLTVVRAETLKPDTITSHEMDIATSVERTISTLQSIKRLF